MHQKNPQEPAKTEDDNPKQEVHLLWDGSSQDPDLGHYGMKPSRTPSDLALKVTSTKDKTYRGSRADPNERETKP
jgi:hypothetical protein